MKVVILCGGKGTRLREETEFRPKPLVDIGEMPILWHIMKIYSHYGFNEFVLCLGYKGEMIKDFFLNYEWMANDFTMNLKNRMEWITHFRNELEDWKITFADTEQDALTARRIKLVERYVDGDTFMLTYGDGVADLDINKLIEFHKAKGKLATITALHPVSRWGVIEEEGGIVTAFREKPKHNDLINAGFMVFNKELFKHIKEDENKMLEDSTLPLLAKNKQLAVYKHTGFWHCMDTYRDTLMLNDIWKTGKAPWKIWK